MAWPSSALHNMIKQTVNGLAEGERVKKAQFQRRRNSDIEGRREETELLKLT